MGSCAARWPGTGSCGWTDWCADCGCCGALSYHSGRAEEARQFARGIIDAFSTARIDVLVTNAAGCGSAMRAYGELLHHDVHGAALHHELHVDPVRSPHGAARRGGE